MNSPTPIQLVMLPGIATDQRLFAAQRERFPDLIVPKWPTAAESCRTAEDFAKLCWEKWTVGVDRVIDSDQPFIIGGTSAGGIMAAEIGWLAKTHAKPPLAVVLVASCRSWRAVPRWYGRWADWSSKLPHWIANKLFVRRHLVQSLQPNDAGREVSELVEAMYQSTEWSQLMLFARMMATWRREDSDAKAPPFPLHQLHGRLDALLPKPSPKDATLLLDAGHWLTVTHAAAVNNWIEAIVRDIALHRSPPKRSSGAI